MDEAQVEIALKHHKSGRLAEAEAIYKNILSENPRHPTVLNYHGVLAIQTGEIAQAVRLLQRAVEVNPRDASFQCNLGEALRQASRLDEAISWFEKALRLKPGLAVAHNNLGIALARRGDLNKAIASYERAIAIQPDYAEAHGNLGSALKDANRYVEAVAQCRVAVTLKPNSAECQNQLGAALAENGDIDAAIAAYEAAIQINPTHVDAHSNLGNALAAQGRVQDAVASCEKAVVLGPDSIAAHWNFAVALLRAGDYQRGWIEHEWRLRPFDIASRPRFSQPAWNGKPLAGRTILLHAEQGFGDTIQFIRFAALIAAMNAKVIVECPQELLRLFRQCPALDGVIARGEALPAFDEHAPLMSLPFLLDIRLNTLPSTVPYLDVDEALRSRWKDRLTETETGARRALRVGLCWGGNRAHRNDRDRSIPPQALRSLPTDGVIFHGIQKEAAASSGDAIRMVDHAAALKDFADTAALVSHLDHVITVDTAVAHLCGALGIATSLLLPAMADWRWMLHRAESAWYPTIRIYRQKRRGDWAEVLQRVGRSLKLEMQRQREPD